MSEPTDRDLDAANYIAGAGWELTTHQRDGGHFHGVGRTLSEAVADVAMRRAKDGP